ncbi:MAG TPA: hypothetical protein VMB50_13890 [Myxococcales bacterium]|nr:hypothetical protein [Myxococcales bacterium]
MRRFADLVAGLAIAALAAGCSGGKAPPPDAGPSATFASQADDAAAALLEDFYASPGNWNACFPTYECFTDDVDWGADSMTDALYLRWVQTKDPAIVPVMAALGETAAAWPPCNLPGCQSLSDVPQWDSVAASRVYAVTQDAGSLARAESDFAEVDASDAFALGACPSIDYQQAGAGGGANQMKTLETDSNYLKAAILLFEETSDPSYLAKAVAKYGAIREYFLDPDVPLYTAYVFDDGGVCSQLPRRFFASVNGNLIWAGVHLATATGEASYLDDAVATGSAVAADLGDARGLYAALEAEDDVGEPLVEGMAELAGQGQAFARSWLLANARASLGSRTPHGLFGRYFNGPPPQATVTEWQANGGFALSFAAATLAPDEAASPDRFWSDAGYVDAGYSNPPFAISFTGSGIALVGTIGQVCCKPGHAQVLVDGTETFDETGIWQNASPTQTSIPGSILFSWRWPSPGPHTLQLEPAAYNPWEGGPFLQLQGYYVAP